MGKLLLIPFVLVSIISYGQTKINMVILRKGQKVFLERGDFMKDKVYAITDRTDTVLVVIADQTFYKFKRGDFEAWAITHQLNETTDILANESFLSFPFKVKTDRTTVVYKEGKMGADKILELKKGIEVNVLSKVNLFYEIEFDKGWKGYIVTTEVPGLERERSSTHLMRAIFDQINGGVTGQDQEKYVRSNGELISLYESEGYKSETYKIGNTIYLITKYNGRTEVSSYTRY